ncbi:hypothetical protein AVEN_9669-1 [Araneus ventricosus]|uniref:Uncharacterized protein n=1 Tax=Araneus ventricosus TaxID=182803 RepID=A0A4Y2MKB7_ARAVE|nr:hypothetical protein AVEN_9669-1 [Araneus ventricosus]
MRGREQLLLTACVDIDVYDASGNIVHIDVYDASGNIVHIDVYDASGNIVHIAGKSDFPMLRKNRQYKHRNSDDCVTSIFSDASEIGTVLLGLDIHAPHQNPSSVRKTSSSRHLDGRAINQNRRDIGSTPTQMKSQGSYAP